MDDCYYRYCQARCLTEGQRLRKQLLRDIYYRVPLCGSTLAELNAYYGYGLEPGACQLMLLRAIGTAAPEAPVPLEVLLKVEEKMRRDLTPVFRELETAVLENRILCLFNITTHRDAPETGQFKLAIGRFFAELSTSGDYGGYAYVMSEGIPAESVQALDQCLQSAIQAMEYGAVYGLNQRYDSYEQVQSLGDILSILTASRERKLRQLVAAMDRAGLDAFVEEVLQDSYDQVRDAPALAYRLPHRLLDLTADALGAFAGGAPADGALRALWHQRIDDCLDLERLRQLTKSGVRALCEETQKQRSGRCSPAVTAVKAYIHEHYREKLYLSDLAEMVHLNHQYLSVLFKKETGIGISDYITEIRMEQARFLLRNTTGSIASIAEAVGYPDPQYFSRRFRRSTGLPPQTYRGQENPFGS